ncbi:MAG: aldehyde ferredoxin oxidoreductase family protein [Candidatus Hodarchaeota archaeon]
MGKILRVNLATKKISIEDVTQSDEIKYIGGAGVAAAIFNSEVSPDINAFDGENLLIFSVGPFCGTSVPFCGRHFVMAKSPLTKILGESSAGGFFGKEMKSAGFDHIIIQGKSEKPVYLWINNDKVEIIDASDIWKAGTKETEAKIKKSIGDNNIKVASIGPAGVNLVKFAAIISETQHAAGRCGMGAVMGSKNLKAIAIKGDGQVIINNEEMLNDAVKEIRNMVKEDPMANVMKDTGTLVHMDNYVGMGDVPIKNYTISKWLGTKMIGFYALQEKYKIKHYACFNCPVACRAFINYEGEMVAWPEYETLAMMGSLLFIDDLEAIIKWNGILNDLGLDTISLGSTLGAFLEAMDRKLLNLQLQDLGFEPDPENPNEFKIWGSIEPIEKLFFKIAQREEIGDELAEGVRTFCRNNGLPEDLESHGKGLEIPAHEPRCNNMTALDYATSSRGAYHCYEPMHLSSMANRKIDIGLSEKVDRFAIDEAVDAVVKMQDACEAYSAAGGCIFGFWYSSYIEPWVKALNAITGNTYTIEKWMEAGRAIFNLKRKFNLSCGITKEDDTIGSRFFNAIPKGGTRKNIPPVRDMVKKYYNVRDWDENGHPK